MKATTVTVEAANSHFKFSIYISIDLLSCVHEIFEAYD